MRTIKNSQQKHLPDISTCHMSCFPASLASKLGRAYVQKTLEWFLVNPNRFLYHIEIKGEVVGYCGGFKPVKPGDGSSSGMLQHAFNAAIRSLLFRPWLLCHPEVAAHYPFLWLNIKRKVTGNVKPIKPVSKDTAFKPFIGLVVIGVHPDHRGAGIAQQLLAEFEDRSRLYQQKEMVLSVKKDNPRAIKAYQNFGWTVREEHAKTYVMNKLI